MDKKFLTHIKELSELPFLAVFAVYFIFSLFCTSTFFLPFPPDFEKRLFLLLCISLIPRIPYLLKEKKTVLLAAGFLALNYALVYHTNHYRFALFSALFTIGFTGLEHQKVMQFYTLILSCFLVLTFSAACCGAIQDFVYLKDGYVRSALGICYPTDMASYVLFLLMYAWAAWKKLTDPVAAVFGIICFFFSRYIAMSITSTILSALFTSVVLVHFLCVNCGPAKRLPSLLKKMVQTLMILSFPLLGILIFTLIFAYAKNFGPALRINSILSNRLRLPLAAYHQYGLKAFGSPLTQVGNGFSTFTAIDYNFVDSTYPLILLRYGWVLFTTLCFTWSVCIRKAFRNRDTRLACILVLIAVHSFSEHHFIEVHFNPLVVMPFALYLPGAVGTEISESQNSGAAALKAELLRSTPLLLAIGAFAGIAVLALPRCFTWMRTLIQIQGWTGGGENGLRVLRFLSGFYLLLLFLILGLCFVIRKYFLTRKFSIFPATAAAGSLFLLAFVFHSGNQLFIDSLPRYRAPLVEENKALKFITASASGKVYMDSVPGLYQQTVDGISDSLFLGDELARFYNTSVITDRNYDSFCLINSGFLFTPISSTHALYTNDQPLINALKEKGLHLTGYYNEKKEVDLPAFADMNQLPTTQDGGLLLSGTDHPLKYGPYLSLYMGEYTAEYDLKIEEDRNSDNTASISESDDVIGTLRVSAYWGNQILKEHILKRDQFDEIGHAVMKLTFNSQNYPGIEFLAFPNGAHSLEISAIRYYRSPEYDVHMLYNRNRQKYREEYYSTAGQLTETTGGYAAREFEYDYDGRMIETRYYNTENQPAVLTAGYSSLKRQLDQRGRTVSESYFGPDGEPILCSGGYASNAREYDQNNNAIVQKFFDTSGNLTATTSLYAEVHRTFNDKHQVILEKYYDTEGKPFTMPTGYAMLESQYDSTGRPYIQKYLDEAGNPVLMNSNYAEIHREYTPQNWVAKETYYGTDGQPVYLPAGYSMLKKEYNNHGNAILIEYCDTDGVRVMTTMNYAAVRREYNERNQIIYESYYGIDDQPLTMPNGYSAVAYERNSVGDPIDIKYYNGNGILLNRDEGYAEIKREYNELRLPVHDYYLDAEGQPVITSMQYSEIRREYNTLRQVSKEYYYGIDSKPIALSSGYASISYERDSQGNALVLRYFDTDGNPTIRKEGYAELHRTYNKNRQITSESFFDIDGNPVLNTSGAHRIEYVRDDRNRVISFRYYDSDGNPTLIGWGYFEENRSYNSDGSIAECIYYDKNSNIVIPPS